MTNVQFDSRLIQRYDTTGPRYTSYPPATAFSDGFRKSHLLRAISDSNATSKPLSLYIHVPFCATVCFYCACSKVVTKQKTQAEPYIAMLKREIDLYQPLIATQRQVKQIHWGGGTPTFLTQEQIDDVMEYLRANFTVSDDAEIAIEIDPRTVSPKSIMQLRNTGFNRISFGVQDFNVDVQRAVNRMQSYEATANLVHAARDAGIISINIDLIYGLPRQTPESFRTTIDQVVALGADRLSIFNYAHMPDRFPPQRRISVADLPSQADKLAILQTAITRLLDAGYEYIGMDHFAKPDNELAVAQRQGTLQRNFQGYSTLADCDLIGLGVTSISKIGYTYSQNVRTLDAYYRRIDTGELPIERGVTLDQDDEIRRDIISSLICYFKLDFEQTNRKWGIDFHTYFAEELVELRGLQQDGLLTIDAKGILVEPRGRLLIRNICMVFDRYLTNLRHRYSRVI